MEIVVLWKAIKDPELHLVIEIKSYIISLLL